MTVKDLTEKIKSNLDSTVIWGGVHVNIRPEECIKYADMICLGEGEEAILEVANNIKNGTTSNIQNIWVKENDNIIKNDIRPFECNLDKYPFQDYDIEDHYILFHDFIVKMTPALLKEHLTNDPLTAGKVAYDLVTTRNCPHNCTYCNNNFLRKMYKGKGPFVRMRSSENVIEEIETITRKFDFFSAVSIKDDVFFVRKVDDIKNFSKLYKEKINLHLRCILSPMFMDEEKYKDLIDAGMVNCGVGIQAYNEKTLEVFKRRSSLQLIRDCVNTLDKYPAKPEYHFIIDNPFEEKESIRETLRFIATMPRNLSILLFSLIPFPGTEIHDRAAAEHLIIDEIDEIYTKDWHDPQKKKYYTYLMHMCVHLKNKNGDPQKIKKLVYFLSSRPVALICDNAIFLTLLRFTLKTKKRFSLIKKKLKNNIIEK